MGSGRESRIQTNESVKILFSRYWGNLIRKGENFERHVDYIHYNLVKDGYVNSRKHMAIFEYLPAYQGWYYCE